MESVMTYNDSPASPRSPIASKASNGIHSPTNGANVINHSNGKKNGYHHISKKNHQNSLQHTPSRPRLHRQESVLKVSPNLESTEDSVSIDQTMLQPLKQLEFIGNKSISILKAFTLVIIVLPTFSALILPLVFPKWSADIDLASVFTDILMIIAIALFVTFSIEWPWKWLQQVRKAKNIHLTSVSDLFSESTHALSSRLYEDSDFVNEVSLVLKLQKYQNIALCSCFGGIFIGTLLMVWSRTFIVSAASKKETVFNNFNITLFFLWGLFRSTLCVYDILQENTTRPKEQQAVLNEYNLHMLTSDIHDREMSIIETARNRYHFLTKMFSRNKLREVTAISELYLFQSTLDSTKGDIKALQRVMNEIVVSLAQHQSTMATLLKPSDSTSKRMDQIQEPILQRRKSDTSKSSFVKPFPLNMSPTTSGSPNFSNCLSLPIEENIGRPPQEHGNAFRPLPKSMTTIFEEPTRALKEPRAQVPTPTEPNNNTHGYFSLHGLPFSSAIKELITRRGTDGQPKVYDQGELLKNLDGYEGDHTTNFEKLYQNVPKKQDGRIHIGMTNKSSYSSFILNTFDELVQKLSHISFKETVMNPLAMIQIYFTDILPIIEKFGNDCHDRAAGHLEKLRKLLWNFFNTHIFQKQQQLTKTAVYLHRKYIQSVKQIFKIYKVIFISIPFNVARFIISVIMFFPKIFFKSFILYPIMIILDFMLDKDGQLSQNPNFLDIKKFHLEPTKKGTFGPENLVTPFRTRTFLLNQLARYCAIELKPDYKYYTYGDSTPVVLTGDS